MFTLSSELDSEKVTGCINSRNPHRADFIAGIWFGHHGGNNS